MIIKNKKNTIDNTNNNNTIDNNSNSIYIYNKNDKTTTKMISK